MIFEPVYTAPVTSKKGVIGIGVPIDLAAKSRNTAQSCGFFLRAPFLAARWESRKARRFTASAGSPVRQSCRAASLIGVEVAVIQRLTHLEAIMAKPQVAAFPAHITPARIVDAVDDLADHHKAFEAVERLISVSGDNLQEDLSHLNRSELSWLMLVLNASMREQIRKLKALADEAYEHHHAKGV